MLGPQIFSLLLNNIYVTAGSTQRDQFRPQLYCNLQQRFIVTIQCQLRISPRSSCLTTFELCLTFSFHPSLN